VNFHFRAVTHGGQTASGRLEAPTAEQARKILLSQGAQRHPDPGGAASATAPPLSADDLALFFCRFATLLASGVTIDAALDNLSRSEEGLSGLGSVIDRLLALRALRTHPQPGHGRPGFAWSSPAWPSG
jgi:type II secretory pathway component PulF